jgi:hypothetical protein
VVVRVPVDVGLIELATVTKPQSSHNAGERRKATNPADAGADERVGLISGDSERLQQVMNLISNAIAHP